MNNKNIVIQHNDLISGRHNWSLNEIKIILSSLKLVSDDNLTVEMKRKDVISLIDDKNVSTRDLKNISKKLASKIFEIYTKDKKKWSILTWFSKIDYEDGLFTIEYNHHMKPYLLNLKKNFTKFNIQNILPMKSSYSMRIYQLLKQYQKIGHRKFEVENLRNILQIPNSYTYNNVKKIILMRAQEEMKLFSDLTFEFEEIKTGRKITDINFIIKKKENHKDILEEDKEENPWYYTKYYDKNIIQSEIEYKCITDIIEKNNILIVTFKDGDSIKVKDEDALIQILAD